MTSSTEKSMELEAIKYVRGDLEILNQILLPHDTKFIVVQTVTDAWSAIKKMQVRGAPAIAIVGCLSLAVELTKTDFDTTDHLLDFVMEKLDYLVTARPTAVNISEATNRLKKLATVLAKTGDISVDIMKEKLIVAAEEMMTKDIEDNKAIGRFGAENILALHENKPVRILTHCNTGSLATAGYGTALGVARALNERGKLEQVYCTETRPYNQGARLTAYELVHENIPGTLICDSMAAILMKIRDISAVIVGADRVVSNGDTANKVGTYQLAIIAKHHNIPFYVAAPSTSCDLDLHTGDHIEIEERPHHEMRVVEGVPVAHHRINCWNPAFDVTPHDLITGGIITEVGIFRPSQLKDGLLRALEGIRSEKIIKK